jgi:ATP-dependent DNA ligase
MEIFDGMIVDNTTGEVLGSAEPKFTGWKFEDYAKEFDRTKEIRFLEPQTAQELGEDKLKEYLKENDTIAEEKYDGHRALNYLTSKGQRLFSRRVSKETGWFSENTDQVPHIRDLIIPEHLYGTVLDNEGLLPVEGCCCRTMQSVMGALPETAIANQLKMGFAYLSCFDILYYCGVNIQAMPYWKRKLFQFKVIKEINSPFIRFAPLYMTQETYNKVIELWKSHKEYDEDILEYVNVVEDYEELCVQFIKEGREGLIIKNIHDRYVQKRSKSFVKMKAHRTYDVVIMGYEDPTSEVNLEDRKTDEDDWLYWEDYEGDLFTNGKPKHWNEDEFRPVTKFYAMGWIGAIKFGVWKERHLQYFLDLNNGNLDEAKKCIAVGEAKGTIREGDKHHWELIEVGQTSGVNDDIREEISNNKEKYLGTVIEVEAQGIINSKTGSLQHPRFKQFRWDKESEQCTFNDHIRKYDEEDK